MIGPENCNKFENAVNKPPKTKLNPMYILKAVNKRSDFF